MVFSNFSNSKYQIGGVVLVRNQSEQVKTERGVLSANSNQVFALSQSRVSIEEQRRIDHDQLFKDLIQRFFYPFVELFLPDLAKQMDRNYLKFLDKEVKKGKSMVGDLLVEVRLASEAKPVLIHIECQASKVSNYSQKMLDYNVHFYSKYNQKVVSVVVYSHSSIAEEPSKCALTVADRTLMEFHFDVIHLCREPWRKYLKRPNTIAAGFLVNMQYDQEERVDVSVEFYRMLSQLKLTVEDIQALIQFHESYLVLSEEEKFAFQQHVIFRKEVKILEMMISFEKKGVEKVAKRMLALGFEPEKVSVITELPLEHIQNLT